MKEMKKIAADTLSLLGQNGAEKASVSVMQRQTREFNVDSGKFSLFRTLYDRALGMTAYCEGKRGSVALNRFDADSIEKTVRDCIAVASSGKADPAFDIAPYAPPQHFTLGATECDTEALFVRTQELLQTIKEKHPKILVEQMVVSHVKSDSVFANSNGVLYTRSSGAYVADLTYSAHEGEAASSFFGSSVMLDRLDRPFYECGAIKRELAEVERQLYPTAVQGKFIGTVLFPPSCFADMLWSALSNFADDAPLLDGTSIWRDKLGCPVAHTQLNVSLCPHDDRIVCGERVSDDGFLSEDFDVIRNGVLQSFLLSFYVSNKTGLPRAKNSSGALIVGGGERTVEQIIGGIEHGIIVGRFSGGEPSANGDFSGVAKNSFLIEHGKVVGAVNETMIGGNLAKMLFSLHALSKEREADGASVLPWAAFDGITISGK